MRKAYKTGKRYHRPIPCPSYEVAKIEAWLSDLAEEGLLLADDGIFAGIATFEYKGPQKAKYRLEAMQKRAGAWSDSDGEPDPEQIALSEKYAWTYVAKLRDFHIYRSLDPDARELNTDPQVEALALRAVKKRARSSLILSLIILLLYPIVLTHGCILLTTIAMGTVWMLLALLFCVLTVAGEIRAFVHLKRMQRSLQRDGCDGSDPDWKTGRTSYLLRKAADVILGVFLLCSCFRAWGISRTDANKIPLTQYQDPIPFATIQDFAGDGASDYALTMAGLFGGINTIETGKDWISPCYITYNEHAEVKTADGKRIDGGLYIEYCALRNPTLARRCAKEFYRLDRFKMPFRSLDPLETPNLDADYAIAYRNDVHFPTVILQRGNIVVHAYFYQTSPSYEMPLAEWAAILCDSLRPM